MDILLINPPYPRRHGSSSIEPIGLLGLSAVLGREGAKVEILDLAARFPNYSFGQKDRDDMLAALLPPLAVGPRLVGLGPVTTAALRPVHDILEIVKQNSSATTVIGGPLCAAPGIEEVVGGYLAADLYVAGDGEMPIKRIWQAIRAGQPPRALADELPGTGVPGSKRPSAYWANDLDSIPVPDRGLVGESTASARRSIHDGRTTAAFLSRGCPYSCTFCAAPITSGRRVRRFSRERVIAEVKSCQENGYDTIIFYDDCLFVRGAQLDTRIDEFASSLDAAGWSGVYQLELRADAVVAMSAEALEALVRSGCRQVNMGIEKGHAAALHQMRKRLAPELPRQAVERLNAAGIRAAGTFIVGGIGETPSDASAVGDYAASLTLDFAHFNPLAIYPGTKLYNDVFGDRHWLPLCLDEEWAPRGDILWRSAEMPLADVLNGVSRAYEQFYTPDRLASTLSRAPQAEHEAIRQAYDLLRNKRSMSWA